MAFEKLTQEAINYAAQQFARALSQQGVLSTSGLEREKTTRKGDKGPTFDQAAAAKKVEKTTQDINSAFQQFNSLYKEHLSNKKTLRQRLKDIGSDFSSGVSEQQDMNRNIASYLDYGSKIFQRTLGAIDDVTVLNKQLPKLFGQELSKAQSQYAQTLSKTMNDLADVYAAQQKIEGLPEVKSSLKQVQDSSKTFEQAEEDLRKIGYTSNDVAQILGKDLYDNLKQSSGKIGKNTKLYTLLGNKVDSLENETIEATKAIGNFAQKARDADMGGGASALGANAAAASGKIKRLIGAFTKTLGSAALIGKALQMLGAEGLEASRAAMKFGSTIEVTKSRLAGMVPSEYAELVSEHRQAILASKDGFQTFHDTLTFNQAAMVEHTGNLAEASRTTANMISTTQQLGNSMINVNRFVGTQQEMFKDFNKIYGMTAEQFRDMNNQLVQDTELRGNLYKLGEKRRSQYFLETQQNYKRLRSQGLLHDQALQLTKTFEEMAGMSPKERMKEAYKTRAFLGAMGMGEEGEEIARIRMKTAANRTPEERQRIQQIMTDVNKRLGPRMGQDFQSELLISQMIEKAGLQKYFGPQSGMVDATLATERETKEGTKLQARNNQILGDLKEIIGFSNEKIAEGVTKFDKFRAGWDVKALTTLREGADAAKWWMDVTAKNVNLIAEHVEDKREQMPDVHPAKVSHRVEQQNEWNRMSEEQRKQEIEKSIQLQQEQLKAMRENLNQTKNVDKTLKQQHDDNKNLQKSEQAKQRAQFRNR